MSKATKNVHHPIKEIKLTQKDILRFWEKVNKADGEEDCWEWIPLQGKCRYGQFAVRRSGLQASRVSWVIANGDIPRSINGSPVFVCHKCDNPKCVNPKHLFLGSPKDNVNDMLVKGRQVKGEASKRAVLTNENVIEIRRLNREFGFGKRKIAKLLNVSTDAVSGVIRGITWLHITDELILISENCS